jgi:hypothetical protein
MGGYWLRILITKWLPRKVLLANAGMHVESLSGIGILPLVNYVSPGIGIPASG